jgi:hypothetical protein
VDTKTDERTRLTAQSASEHVSDIIYAAGGFEDALHDPGEDGALPWPASDDDTEAIALWSVALDAADALTAEIRDYVAELRRDLTARLQVALDEGRQS